MPDLTTISGTVTDANGAAVVGALLTILKVVKDGEVLSPLQRTAKSVAEGAISFVVHRGSTIKVKGTIIGLDRETWLTVPDAATAALEDLIPATSPPSSAVSQSAFNAHTAKLANPDDPGHIKNVGSGLILEDGVISLAGVYTAEVSADATLEIGDATRALIEIDTSAVRPVIELPPMAGAQGRTFTFVMNDDTNGADIDGSGSEMIGSALVYNFDAVRDSFVTLTPGVSAWRVTGKG